MEPVKIDCPPKNADEATARALYIRELAQARGRAEKKLRRPPWMRAGYWRLLRLRALAITHEEVDKAEFDSAFPRT